MLKSSLRCFLFTLILCLGYANARAQALEMVAPPIPSVIPPPPPDPDTLPAPPQLEWEPLVPKGSEEAQPPAAVISVDPPVAETAIAPPPPPVIEIPLPGGPDPAKIELAKPELEIWRESSEFPQIPGLHFDRLDQVYITGTAPVWLRVQFNPALAGKSVYVRPGPGITLNPPAGVLTVAPNGECLILAQLEEGLARSHVILYCERVRTVLPVVRASLATVVGNENETGGGQ